MAAARKRRATRANAGQMSDGPRDNRRCDQERLVRRKVRCEYSTEIRKRRLAGANPARPKPPSRSVATPCDGSRQRARRCVGAQADEPCEVSPERSHVLSAHDLGGSEGNSLPSELAHGVSTKRGLGARRVRRRRPRNLGYPDARWRAGGSRQGRPEPKTECGWESEGPVVAKKRGNE